MPEPSAVRARGSRTSVGFALQGSFTAGGRTISHRQYLSDHYVLTEFEGSSVLFSADHGERFLVDRVRRQLVPMDVPGHRVRLEHIQTVLGTVVTECSSRVHVVDGYPCRLHSLRNERGRIDILAEAWCTTLPGAEMTALHRERAIEAQSQPFFLPLASDEIVVRSMFRTRANGVESRQMYQLLSLACGSEQVLEFDVLLDYPVRGGAACSVASPE